MVGAFALCNSKSMREFLRTMAKLTRKFRQKRGNLLSRSWLVRLALGFLFKLLLDFLNIILEPGKR